MSDLQASCREFRSAVSLSENQDGLIAEKAAQDFAPLQSTPLSPPSVSPPSTPAVSALRTFGRTLHTNHTALLLLFKYRLTPGTKPIR